MPQEFESLQSGRRGSVSFPKCIMESWVQTSLWGWGIQHKVRSHRGGNGQSKYSELCYPSTKPSASLGKADLPFRPLRFVGKMEDILRHIKQSHSKEYEITNWSQLIGIKKKTKNLECLIFKIYYNSYCLILDGCNWDNWFSLDIRCLAIFLPFPYKMMIR